MILDAQIRGGFYLWSGENQRSTSYQMVDGMQGLAHSATTVRVCPKPYQRRQYDRREGHRCRCKQMGALFSVPGNPYLVGSAYLVHH